MLGDVRREKHSRRGRRIAFRAAAWVGVLALAGLGIAAATAFERGLAVGDRAPDFTLSDQAGSRRSLASLLARRSLLAIVFYRSADW